MIKIYFRDCATWLAAIDELVGMSVEHTISDAGRGRHHRYIIEIAWSSGD